MIVYDVLTKVLGTELFSQNKIADLNSGITLFRSVKRSFYGERK